MSAPDTVFGTSDTGTIQPDVAQLEPHAQYITFKKSKPKKLLMMEAN